jgi:hypothetical protein
MRCLISANVASYYYLARCTRPCANRDYAQIDQMIWTDHYNDLSILCWRRRWLGDGIVSSSASILPRRCSPWRNSDGGASARPDLRGHLERRIQFVRQRADIGHAPHARLMIGLGARQQHVVLQHIHRRARHYFCDVHKTLVRRRCLALRRQLPGVARRAGLS